MEASLHHRVHNIEQIHVQLKGLFYIENRTWRFKAFYFLFFFGCGTLRNYLPVYFKHIGLSALLTGVLTGVRPFTGFISAPFFSFLADKTGSHKSILLVALIVSVLSYFSLSFVAIVRQIESSRAEYCTVNQTSTMKTSVGHVQKYRDLTLSQDMNSPLRIDSNTTTDSLNVTISCDTTIFSETTIFFASIAMLISGDFFNAPVGAIMSSTVIYWEGSSQFGKQRVFGAIGFGIGSFLTGVAIDKTMKINYFDSDPSRSDTPNYLTAFFMYLCANGLLFLLISCGLNVVREEKSKIMWSRVKAILSDKLVVCFLCYVFIMGVVGGVIILFLFWYLESLGASQSLLGLSSAAMSLSEIPVFIVCSKFIQRIGHVGVLGVSLTLSVLRVTLYSILTNPWYVLLIEPLHGITLAATWSASISFGSLLSSPELYTTMEGVITGFHFGLGWGLGAVFGGVFYNSYGPRNLFRGCIVLCGVASIFLVLVYRLQHRKNSIVAQLNEIATRETVNINAGDYDIIPGEDIL